MIDMGGKVAIVTGGASGMGQIAARRLAREGAKVAIFDVNEQGLADTAAEADNITAFRCDISNLADVEAKVAEVVRLMAMLSLFNRQIDVLAAVPDAQDRAIIKDEFVEELEDACDDDPGMLLAGAVDLAVKETMEVFE